MSLNRTTVAPWTIHSTYANITKAKEHDTFAGWLNSPHVRGTGDILWSCSLTLVACIYTSIHLNIQRHSTGKSRLKAKLKWAAMALFAPEFILASAFVQYRRASKFVTEYWAIRQRQPPNPKDRKKASHPPEWGLKFAMFVLMGGIRIDITQFVSEPDLDPDARYKFSKYKHPSGEQTHTGRMSLSGVLKMAERGHHFYIYDKDIDCLDKSDWFGKLLVAMQVFYMVVSCLARVMSTKVSPTVLELHTAIHALCTLLSYCLWFPKPLDVQDAMYFGCENKEYDIARMVQQQFYSSWADSLAIFPPRTEENPEPPCRVSCHKEPMRWVEPKEGLVMRQGDILPSGLALHREQPGRELILTSAFLHRWDVIMNSLNWEFLDSVSHLLKPIPIIPWDERLKHWEHEDTGTEQWTPEEAIKYKLGYEEIDRDGENQALYLGRFPGMERNWSTEGYADLPFVNGGNFATVSFKTEKSKLLDSIREAVDSAYSVYNIGYQIVIIALTFVYGLLQFWAYELVFPTEVERKLWQASSLISSVTLGGWAFITVIIRTRMWMGQWRIVPPGALARDNKQWPLIIVYTLARVFLVVEAFISIRECSVGAYWTLNWLEMLPHV